MLKVKRLVVILCSMCLMLLAAGCSGAPLNVTISCDGEVDELGDAYFTIQTSLPDETSLLVSIKGVDGSGLANGRYSDQKEVKVSGGKAVAGPFQNGNAPLPEGEYQVEVKTKNVGMQPASVQRVIGKNGGNLRGDNVVSSEKQEQYVQYNIAWEMPDFSENLIGWEKKVYLSAVSGVILDSRILEDKNDLEQKNDLRYTEFCFSNVIIDNTVSRDLEEHYYLSAMIDYTAKGYHVGSGESFEKDEKQAFLLDSGKAPWSSGRVENMFGACNASAQIIDGFFEQIEAEKKYFDQSAIIVGEASEYTKEELHFVNLALNQTLGLYELALPTKEDFDDFVEEVGILRELIVFNKYAS